MTLLVGFLLLNIVVIGMGLSYLSDVDFAFEERIAYGAFFGLIAYVIAALLTTRLFGFNGGAVFLAVAVGHVVSVAGWRTGINTVGAEAGDAWRRLKRAGDKTSHLPFLLLFIIPAWIWTVRILTVAYRSLNGGIGSGNLAIFSDWQAHSTYTASFALAGNTGFDLPTATGEALRYHNAINYFAATLVPAGASIQSALTISSGFCAFFFPMAMYLAGHRIMNSRLAAGMGTALFFLFGGLGWTHFFSTERRTNPRDLNSEMLTDVSTDGIFTTLGNLPTRYTRFYDAGYWMENSVVGHLYPQRPTLIGFPVTIITGMLLWSAYKRRSTRTFLFAGVLVGLMPFFHLFGWLTPLALGGIWAIMAQFEDRTFQPPRHAARFGLIIGGSIISFLLLSWMFRNVTTTDEFGAESAIFEWPHALAIVGLIAVTLLLFAQFEDLEWRPEWLWFLVPAVGLSAIVAFFMLPPESNPDYTYSWVIRTLQGQETDPSTGMGRLGAVGEPVGTGTVIVENIRFWWKNTGFFLPLLFAAHVAIGFGLFRTSMPSRVALATMPIWLWLIIPNMTRLHPWEGNQTHYFIFAILVGAFPVAALMAEVYKRYTIVGTLLVPLLFFSMTFAGVLDIYSSGDTDTEAWDLMTASDVLMADWVKDNTDQRAVFVVADDNTHPMSSLTGRPIVAGFNGWIFDLGIPDWWDRTQNSAQILQGGEATPALLDQYNVDYVVIGPRELNSKGANIEYWDQNGRLEYDFGGYRIYKVS